MIVPILTRECIAQREDMIYPSSWLKDRAALGWKSAPLGLWPWVTSALLLQETLGRVAASGLPALLLKCLYLFFVFPLEKEEVLENDVQVQRMFVQVSQRKAPHPWAKTPLCFLEVSDRKSVV